MLCNQSGSLRVLYQVNPHLTFLVEQDQESINDVHLDNWGVTALWELDVRAFSVFDHMKAYGSYGGEDCGPNIVHAYCLDAGEVVTLANDFSFV